MPNLITELGGEYITTMYSGAYFLHDDEIHMLDRVRGDGVYCLRRTANDRWENVLLPYNAFADMSKFAWPALGYRNLPYKKHNLVVEFGMLRSAKRGLRRNLLTAEGTKAGALFNQYVPWAQVAGDELTLAKTILKPTYFSLAKAREELLSGKAIGCAINPNLAIEINPFTDTQLEFSVLFRGAKVGSMNAEGGIEVPSRLAARIK